MSTPLFSSGPWYRCQAIGQPWTIEDSKGTLIALAQQQDADLGRLDRPVRTANAQLISAAPDLYVAVQRLMAAYACRDPADIMLAEETAQCALAKATDLGKP